MSVPKASVEVWAEEIWNRSWRARETIHHRYLRDLTSSTGDKVEGRESVPLKWSCHACNFLSNAQPSGRWIREWGFSGRDRQSCVVEKESEGAQHGPESIAWTADRAVQVGHGGMWSRKQVTGGGTGQEGTGAWRWWWWSLGSRRVSMMWKMTKRSRGRKCWDVVRLVETKI